MKSNRWLHKSGRFVWAMLRQNCPKKIITAFQERGRRQQSTLPEVNTTTYMFRPEGQCATEAEMTVVVTDQLESLFDPIGPLCVGDTETKLPGTSLNGFTGKWNTEKIDASVPGEVTYTFTPDPGQCAGEYEMTIEITDEIVPVFADLGPFCQFRKPDDLPLVSDNGVTGSWDPAIIATDVAGSFKFTFKPAPGNSCAVPETVTIEIIPEEAPEFDPIGPLCRNSAPPALPTESLNGISGTWSPAVISTAGPGNYIFTPDEGECAGEYTLTIQIIDEQIPEFDPIGPLCVGDVAPKLPEKDNNSISGTWSPAVIDTKTEGTYKFEFTPDVGYDCVTAGTLSVTISPLIAPKFDLVGPFCVGDTPPELSLISNNKISGKWNPEKIRTDQPGTFTYEFIPDEAGACVENFGATAGIDSKPPVERMRLITVMNQSVRVLQETSPSRRCPSDNRTEDPAQARLLLTKLPERTYTPKGRHGAG